jgi:hypothetical protein
LRNPFKLAAEEMSAAYAVTPKARSRHRPRGRPKDLRRHDVPKEILRFAQDDGIGSF